MHSKLIPTHRHIGTFIVLEAGLQKRDEDEGEGKAGKDAEMLGSASSRKFVIMCRALLEASLPEQQQGPVWSHSPEAYRQLIFQISSRPWYFINSSRTATRNPRPLHQSPITACNNLLPAMRILQCTGPRDGQRAGMRVIFCAVLSLGMVCSASASSAGIFRAGMAFAGPVSNLGGLHARNPAASMGFERARTATRGSVAGLSMRVSPSSPPHAARYRVCTKYIA